jgi:hypothetical protein
MTSKIQLKRGLKSSMSSLSSSNIAEGEVFVTTNTNEVFSGTGNSIVYKKIGKNPKEVESKISLIEKQNNIVNVGNISKTVFQANSVLNSKIYSLNQIYIDMLENSNNIEASLSKNNYIFDSTNGELRIRNYNSSSFLGGTGGTQGTNTWTMPQGYVVTSDRNISTSASSTLSRFDNLFDNDFGADIGSIFMTPDGSVGGTALHFDFTANGNSGINLGGLWCFPTSGSSSYSDRRMNADIQVSYDGTNWVYVGYTDGMSKPLVTASATAYDIINIPWQNTTIKKMRFIATQLGGGTRYYMGELVLFESDSYVTTKPIVFGNGVKKLLLETEEAIPSNSSGISYEISFNNFATSFPIAKQTLFESIPSGATSCRLRFFIKDMSKLLAYSLSWG